jgi:hypothetical protein
LSIDFFLFILLIIMGSFYLLISKKIIKILFLLLFFYFLFINRLMPKGPDFQSYYDYLSIFSLNLFYLKEFVYYYSTHFLYSLLNNKLLVFLLIDIFWIFLLYRSVKNDFKLFVILILSFPLFMGYLNIYRQFLAEIVALYAYSKIISNNRSFLLYIISIFIHNSMILLFPLFMIKIIKKFSKKVLFLVIFYSLIFLLLNAFHFQKNSHVTGLDLSLVYIVLFFVLNYVFLILFKLKIKNFINRIPSIIIGFLWLIFMKFLNFDSTIIERTGLIFIIFSLYDIYFIFRNNIFIKLLILFIFSLPILIFHSTRSML